MFPGSSLLECQCLFFPALEDHQRLSAAAVTVGICQPHLHWMVQSNTAGPGDVNIAKERKLTPRAEAVYSVYTMLVGH